MSLTCHPDSIDYRGGIFVSGEKLGPALAQGPCCPIHAPQPSRSREFIRDIAPRAANGTSRRRVITILGATAGGLTLGGGALLWGSRRELKPVEWSGLALGSPARIVLYDEDPAHARGLLARVADDIHFFEDQFSLHRSGSAISRLNRTGRLDRPDPAFCSCLRKSAAFIRAERRSFDPTVHDWDVPARAFDHGNPPPLRRSSSEHSWTGRRFDPSADAIVRTLRHGHDA